MGKLLGTLIKRIGLPTPGKGRVLSAIGGLIGLGGGTSLIASEITLTNDFVLDVLIIIAITLITVISGESQVPKELKDQLK